MNLKLSHFNKAGQAHMVDISKKEPTDRTAVATATVLLDKASLALVRLGSPKKGDVLGVARIAGIMAAKKTSDLIPLCHQLELSKVSIDFLVDNNKLSLDVTATVKTQSATGVEMEALTAVSVTALTIYDMLKSVNKTIKISDIKLVLKKGGMSGRATTVKGVK